MSNPHNRPHGQPSSPPPPPQQQQPDDQEPIPHLQSLAPSIFVPVADDLAATPFVAPASRIARLNAILAALDTHAVHVRSNMLALVRRECVRIVRAAAAAEEAALSTNGNNNNNNSSSSSNRANERHHPPQKLRPDGDLTTMIANMQAPHDPARDYNNADIPLPDFSRVQPASFREEATKDLMSSVSRALSELRSFDAYIVGNKGVYEQALKREIESEAQ
ncbi:Uncharacterized protein TPAR_01668 [Tolypocladium paradoxum]|uniref:Uncharacterized protein n=1 Tax=Tolypocladium paradoxum TaxID=94208 RepID=A0A2S4L6R5_9HYPO|nr:Uncharacterized protein TPAR_01668 [Tolypocladium paradoxum]